MESEELKVYEGSYFNRVMENLHDLSKLVAIMRENAEKLNVNVDIKNTKED